MAYHHIVVATNLSEDAEFLLGKGAKFSKRTECQAIPDLYRYPPWRLLR